jgi:hypothetical protein
VSEVNPIVLSVFIKTGKKKNSTIINYIIEHYKIALSSSNTDKWRESIMLSKWWLPIFRLSLVDDYNYHKFMDSNNYPKLFKDFKKSGDEITEDNMR